MNSNEFKSGDLVRVNTKFTSAYYYKTHPLRYRREDFFEGQIGVWIKKQEGYDIHLFGHIQDYGIVLFKEALYFVLRMNLEKVTK